jgi:uncharacterized membrane-anchored protein
MRALGAGIHSVITFNEPNILLLLKPMLPPQVWDIQKLTLETAAKRLGVPKFVSANVAGVEDLPALQKGMLVAHKESVVRSGRRVYLRLAPVDPRSLMQGDYMDLRYDISRGLGDDIAPDGHLVITVDGLGVAWFVRLHDGRPLAPGEQLLRYRRRGWRVKLGAESYFFQEGHAKLYDVARYGELRVTPSGESVLVGLADEKLQRLGPPLR